MADDSTDDDTEFSAPGITDLSGRLMRAAGEVIKGPGRVAARSLTELAASPESLLQILSGRTPPASDQSEGRTVATTIGVAARAGGQAVLESAAVVKDTAASFIAPLGELENLVDLDNRLYPFAPFLLEDASIHAFFLQVNKEKLREYFNEAYNKPSGNYLDLVPACTYITLLIGQFGKARSANKDEKEHRKGFIANDVDVAFWAVGFNQSHPIGFYFVPLNHFIKAPQTMAAGREVFAFPKEPGIFSHLPRRIKAAGKQTLEANTLLALQAHVFNKDGPDGELQAKKILELTNTRGAVDLDGQPASSVEDLFRAVAGHCKGLNNFIQGKTDGDVNRLLKLLGIDTKDFTGRIPVLLHQQVPHPTDSTKVAYRAYLETSFELSAVAAWGHTKLAQQDTGYSIAAKFFNLDDQGNSTEGFFKTHPFDRYGLATSPVVSDSVFWMNGNLKVSHGRVIWSQAFA